MHRALACRIGKWCSVHVGRLVLPGLKRQRLMWVALSLDPQICCLPGAEPEARRSPTMGHTCSGEHQNLRTKGLRPPVISWISCCVTRVASNTCACGVWLEAGSEVLQESVGMSCSSAASNRVCSAGVRPTPSQVKMILANVPTHHHRGFSIELATSM